MLHQPELGVLVVAMLASVPLEWFSSEPQEALEDLSPHWTSMLLCVTCLVQFAVSLTIDSVYERKAAARPSIIIG